MSTKYTVTLHKKGQQPQHLAVASLEDAELEFSTWCSINQHKPDQMGKYAGQVRKDQVLFATIIDGKCYALDGAEIALSRPVLAPIVPKPGSKQFEPLKLYPISKLPFGEGFKFTLFYKGGNATHAIMEKVGKSVLVREIGAGIIGLADYTSWTPDHIDGAACVSGSAWLAEFGEEFQPPLEIRALVAGGALHDVSWHNDVAPSFKIGISTFTVWCDAEDVSLREHTEWNRFWITQEDADGAMIDDGDRFHTDDVKEVLAEIIRILSLGLND